MIMDIEDYFAKGCGRCERFDTSECSTKRWGQGLSDLRQICLAADLMEAIKWAHPCYIYAGRNIAIVGAFREDFRLSFFEAGLMTDPAQVLECQGPNTKHPDMIRFTSNEQPSEMNGVVATYLEEAKAYAEAGKRAPRDTTEPNLPDELIKALDSDLELAEAFHALTPGRRKGYVINLTSAKRSETRHNRIAKFRDKIIAGKGAMER